MSHNERKTFVLRCGRTLGQSWGALNKAWLAFKIAHANNDLTQMKDYACIIRKLQLEMGVQVSKFDDGIIDEGATANIFTSRQVGDIKSEDQDVISKEAQYSDLDYDDILGEARAAIQSPGSLPPSAKMFIPNQSRLLSGPAGHKKAIASQDVSSHIVHEKSSCDFLEDRYQTIEKESCFRILDEAEKASNEVLLSQNMTQQTGYENCDCVHLQKEIDPQQISEKESCFRILDEAEKASLEIWSNKDSTEYDEKDISNAVEPSIAPPEEMYATYYDRSEKTCAVPHDAVADLPVTVLSHTVISKHACSSDTNKHKESKEIVERHTTYPGRTCNFVPSEELEAIKKEHKRNLRSVYFKSTSTKT